MSEVPRRPSDDEILDLVRTMDGPSSDLDHALTLWLGEVDGAAWNRVHVVRGYHALPWFRLEPSVGALAHVVAGWSGSLDAVTALVRHVLPDWWWSVGHCSVSADSTLGPDVGGVDAHLLSLDYRRFDESFALDVRQGHPCLVTIENLVLAKMARDGFPGLPGA